jgi:hypothetical protein
MFRSLFLVHPLINVTCFGDRLIDAQEPAQAYTYTYTEASMVLIARTICTYTEDRLLGWKECPRF